MKRLFSTDANVIGFLASINLAIAGAVKALDMKTAVDVYQNAMHFLVPLGQLGVAAVTIYYILRKARTITVEARTIPPKRKRK
jgi:hypothetical protein